jgi:dTDP-4-amino-4,6-dideoxygalactose transaminase
MVQPMSFQTLFDFESALAEYTGAPYVVVTDGCTHAIELCMRYDMVSFCEFSAFTYLSIPQLMNQLDISYHYKTEYWTTAGEYRFYNTRIWDSARRLERNMYRPGQLQCLSFGHGKPLQLGKGGAILLDNEQDYQALSCMRSDGRDLRITPWQDQEVIYQGFHYCPTLETCAAGIVGIRHITHGITQQEYPDLRKVNIIS